MSISSSTPIIEVRDCLRELVGLFGERGFPETKICHDDNTVKTYPLPEHHAAVVQRARKLLRDRKWTPITP